VPTASKVECPARHASRGSSARPTAPGAAPTRLSRQLAHARQRSPPFHAKPSARRSLRRTARAVAVRHRWPRTDQVVSIRRAQPTMPAGPRAGQKRAHRSLAPRKFSHPTPITNPLHPTVGSIRFHLPASRGQQAVRTEVPCCRDERRRIAALLNRHGRYPYFASLGRPNPRVAIDRTSAGRRRGRCTSGRTIRFRVR